MRTLCPARAVPAFGLTLALLAGNALAAPTAFQNPATAAWGGWNRGDAGTLWAGWDVFNNLVDQTPDLGSFNTDTAVVITNSPGHFVTGGGNIYSFSNPGDFDAIFVPTSLGTGLFNVAVQISVLGTDLDAASVLLNGLSWTSRTVLDTGTSGAPAGSGGTGTGVDNEYLFVWENVSRVTTQDIFGLEFNALSSSMSLDALTIDVGPAPALPDPEPTPVPIPGAVLLLSSGLALLGRGRLAG